MTIENRISPTEDNSVSPAPSTWMIAEKNHALCIENHEITNHIMLLLTGQPMTPCPPLEIPENSDMNLKALLMNQAEMMLSMQRLLKQLAQEMNR